MSNTMDIKRLIGSTCITNLKSPNSFAFNVVSFNSNCRHRLAIKFREKKKKKATVKFNSLVSRNCFVLAEFLRVENQPVGVFFPFGCTEVILLSNPPFKHLIIILGLIYQPSTRWCLFIVYAAETKSRENRLVGLQEWKGKKWLTIAQFS